MTYAKTLIATQKEDNSMEFQTPEEYRIVSDDGTNVILARVHLSDEDINKAVKEDNYNDEFIHLTRVDHNERETFQTEQGLLMRTVNQFMISQRVLAWQEITLPIGFPADLVPKLQEFLDENQDTDIYKTLQAFMEEHYDDRCTVEFQIDYALSRETSPNEDSTLILTNQGNTIWENIS